MAESTNIAWCDATFNCWRGCSKVSAGCKFCYAETLSARNPLTLGVWGPSGTRVVASEAMWKEPLKWERLAREGRLPDGSTNPDGRRPRVFCASLADVFEQWDGPMVDAKGEPIVRARDGVVEGVSVGGGMFVPSYATMGDIRRKLFDLIDRTPNLDWLLLTKRPQNVRGFVPESWLAGFPANVWVGTSVEDQETADARVPHLLRVPARVRFLSMEPLLSDVNLSPWVDTRLAVIGRPQRIGWVIVGGESGPCARPMNIEWARSIVGQCRAAGVPAFVKQFGQNVRASDPRQTDWPDHIGFAAGDYPPAAQVIGLRDRKGGDMAEWPADLRVRELPAANHTEGTT